MKIERHRTSLGMLMAAAAASLLVACAMEGYGDEEAWDEQSELTLESIATEASSVAGEEVAAGEVGTAVRQTWRCAKLKVSSTVYENATGSASWGSWSSGTTFYDLGLSSSRILTWWGSGGFPGQGMAWVPAANTGGSIPCPW